MKHNTTYYLIQDNDVIAEHRIDCVWAGSLFDWFKRGRAYFSHEEAEAALKERDTDTYVEQIYKEFG